MACVARDKEREGEGPGTSDLEKKDKKLKPQVEGIYKRNKTHVQTSDEMLENDVSDGEKGTDPGGGRLQEFEQKSSVIEHVYEYKESGNFTYPHCLKTFTRNHKTTKHIGPFHATGMCYCTDRTESSTGRDPLKTHLARHEEADYSMYCTICTRDLPGEIS